MREKEDGPVAEAQALPHRLFERLAAGRPDAPALFEGGRAISYGELNRRANQLARYLLGRGPAAGRRVAVCLPRSSEMVVSLLAILKAGAAFVPLDSTLPHSRKLSVLRDARPAVLLAADADDAPPEFDGEVLLTRESRARIEQEDASNPEPGVARDGVLCVLYTSGVTGRPKGVVVPARAVLNHMRWMWRAYPFRGSDVGLLHRSYMLISSTWDYLGPLLGGVPSLVMQENEANDPLAIWRGAVASGVTHVSGSPAFWDAILDHAERHHGEWNSMRLATISGEQVSVRIVRRWQRAFPGARLLNVYGSTECVRPTVYDTSSLPAHAERVPIGPPLPNVRVWVADEELRPLPGGEQGEICVSGPCLAEGYLNQPALTAERFMRDAALAGDGGVVFRTGDLGRVLPDGNLEVTGRRDQQVKIRGYRVELGDVEAALLQSGVLRQAAVLATEEASGWKRLVAYVVAEADPPPSSSELRRFLASKLPDYMIPAFFVPLKELPLTRSGKTDWNALPSVAASRRAEGGGERATAPLNATERAMAGIWSEVFELESVGCDDDFYDLGGHSVMAMQIASRVADAFGVELSTDALLSVHTVREMAKCVDELTCPAPAESD
jgi:amino acid adenylation domain-containing protein